MMSLGPAGEIIRLAGDRAAHLHGDIDAALREGLAEYEEDGVHACAGLRLDRDGDRTTLGERHAIADSSHATASASRAASRDLSTSSTSRLPSSNDG